MVAGGEMITAGTSQPLTIATEDEAGNEAQITAEVVQADLPSPGQFFFYFFVQVVICNHLMKMQFSRWHPKSRTSFTRRKPYDDRSI